MHYGNRSTPINNIVWVLVPFLLSAFPAIAQDGAGPSFQAATKFTVKVKSVVKYPSVQDRRGIFTGAGFLVDKSRGWILTNAHVTGRNPSEIKVKFKGKKYVEVKPIYIDGYLDFSLLQVSQENIPEAAKAAKIDCDTPPDVGDAVGAFGHPFGLDFTGSRGIVSGLQFKWLRNWVQTDAAINKGNSGGPLLSLATGQVVGINTSTISKKVGEGIGFAIPAKDFCPILERAKKGLDPSPVLMPVELSLDFDEDKGLNVMRRYSKTPVIWDLKEGDKIRGVSGQEKAGKVNEPKTPGDLITELRKISRTHACLTVDRGGKEQTIKVALKRRPKLLEKEYLSFSGIIVAPRDFRDDEINNPDKYLLIHDVKGRSEGAIAGVQGYDLLASVDGKQFTSVSTLKDYLLKKDGKKVRINLYRRSYSYSSRSTYLLKEVRVSEIGIVRKQI
jgi:S1-C subfamily serine protease